MRTITKLALTLAAIGVLALAGSSIVHAQYYYQPYPPPPAYYPPPPPPPPYGYGYGYRPYPSRYPTWNGCPRGFTVQGGVCKPYRGY